MTIEEYRSNIEWVLRNCKFRDCDSLETKKAVLNKVECGELFIRLFQYRKVDDAVVNGLKYGTIYFTSPIRFNDPYDSLLRWDKQQIDECINNPKYGKVLAQHFIFDSDTLAVSIRNRFRISCFSEVADSPLMWAHYADNGKGFCVEYELPICIGSPLCLKNGQPCEGGKNCSPLDCRMYSKCSLAPVIYDAQRLDTTATMKHEIECAVAHELGEKYDLSSHDWLEPYRTALFKAKDWAYEKEWRLILSDHKLRGNQDCVYPHDRLLRVILGPNMNPLDEYNVSKATEIYAKNSKHDVELAKTYVDLQCSDYKFSIRRERILRGI